MSPYTVPEQITVGGAYTFHDADPHPTERLTLAGVLAHSSNVGMVQVAQHISPQVQYQYFRAFGIGAPSGLPLPGTSPGLLVPLSQYWGQERYTLAFGQGVSVTAVQMASVYATIANGGVRVQPTIVAGTTSADGRFVPAPPPHRQRVLKPKTAAELIAILQQVPMLDATLAFEPWGEIPGYSIAAKTGTAQVGSVPVPVRVELHRDGARQQPAARGGGQRPEPEARELLRQRRGRAGVLSRHEVRAADAEDSAGWGQASQRPAHRTVISGSLCPCLRICVQPASRAGRWPNSPNCSAWGCAGPATR